jgi:hypothetical protein
VPGSASLVSFGGAELATNKPQTPLSLRGQNDAARRRPVYSTTLS